MKKTSILLLALCLFSEPAVATEPIKIGDINIYSALPLTVQAYKNGVALAVKEINAKGGVMGRPLEVLSRDSKLQPGEGVRLAEELVSRDGVSILMNCGGSGVTLALSNWAEKNKIPLLETAAVADSVIWENGNEYLFRLNFGGYMYMSASIDKAIEIYGDKIKGKRWAFVSPNLEYGHAVLKISKKIEEERVLEADWVLEHWTEWNKLNAGATITALKKNDPDIIVSLLLGSDLIKFIREGNKRGAFKDKIVIAPQLALREHLDVLAAQTPAGWISVGFPAEDIEGEEFVRFRQSYMSAYRKIPEVYSLTGYNAVHAIAQAVECAGTTEPSKIRDALTSVTYQTPFGPENFRAIDRQADIVFWVGVSAVENGKGKLVEWKMERARDHMPSDEWIRAQRKEGELKL